MVKPSSHRLTDNVKLLQKAVVMHQGKMLLLRRSEQSVTRALAWDLPGGNSEWPIETEGIIRDIHLGDLSREIKEETDIDTSAFAEEPTIAHFEVVFEAEKQMYTIIAGWKINLKSTFTKESVQLSDEHDQLAWVNPQQYSEFDFGFAGTEHGFVRRIIERALAA